MFLLSWDVYVLAGVVLTVSCSQQSESDNAAAFANAIARTG
jgi:hypothetical protein